MDKGEGMKGRCLPPHPHCTPFFFHSRAGVRPRPSIPTRRFCLNRTVDLDSASSVSAPRGSHVGSAERAHLGMVRLQGRQPLQELHWASGFSPSHLGQRWGSRMRSFPTGPLDLYGVSARAPQSML